MNYDWIKVYYDEAKGEIVHERIPASRVFVGLDQGSKDFNMEVSSVVHPNGNIQIMAINGWLHEMDLAANKDSPMTISESIIASATEGASESQAMSDIEKAARAICERLGHNPDAKACGRDVYRVNALIWVVPPEDTMFPLWTYFTREAEAALSVLDI